MVKMVWDQRPDLEVGVFNCAIHLHGKSIPWSGVTSIKTDTPSEFGSLYQEGVLYLKYSGMTGYSCTVEAYTFPSVLVEDALIRGGEIVGFSYETSKSIYIVYSPQLQDNGTSYSSNVSEVSLFSYSLSSKFPQYRIDKSDTHTWVLEELVDILYGNESEEPRLPSQIELLDIFERGSILRITDHGDGTWTADGPDSAIEMLDATTFAITWPSAIFKNETTYTIRSL